MAKKSLKSRFRSVVYVLLSFVLSFILFSTVICSTLMATVFNASFMLDSMNTSNYYTDKAAEITTSLTDLGYASGLKEEFFDDLVDELLVNSDTKVYIENYYAGVSAKIDKTPFEQRFNEKLDEYIEENNIQSVSSDHRERLVQEASKIYANSIMLPFFGTIFPYFKAIKSSLPFVIAGLVVVAAVICIVFVFTNKWKHRAVKYICYATSGTFLTLIAIPAYLYFSNLIANMNVASRAFYNVILQATGSIEVFILVLSVLFLLISIALFVRHSVMRKSLQSN